MLSGLQVPLKRLYALSAGNDYRRAVVLDLLAEHLLDLLHVLGQRHDDAHMFRRHADAGAYLLQPACSRRVLAAGHTRREVIGDEHYHVRIGVHAIQQSRHARMGERAVADDRYRRMLSRVRCSFRHRHRRTHLHARVDGIEGRECP